MNLRQGVIDSLRIRRIEYRIAEIPILLIPMFLSFEHWSQIWTWPALAGAFAFFFVFAVGDMVNCLADRDLDSVYKPHLTQAVDRLGKRNILVQIALSSLAALFLSLAVAFTHHRPLLPVAIIVGIAMAVAYSVKPIHLKGRGVGQLFFYWLGLFVGPMMMSAMFVVDWPSFSTIAIALSYGLLQTGVILLNTAEDYPEDRAANIRTAVVALGLPQSMLLAVSLIMIGGVTLLALFAYRLVLVQASLPTAIVPLLFCVSTTFVFYAWLYSQIRSIAEQQQIGLIKRFAATCPIWITTIAVSSLWASIMILVQQSRSMS